MSHFANDVHHRTSTRLSQVLPDFVESEYPQFAAFVEAYYEFLEQTDDLPITSTFVPQLGVVTVLSGNSTISGSNTTFTTTTAVNERVRVGSETYRVRSVANNTQMVVFDVPVRTYFANTYSIETNKTERQASGALRKLLTYHDVDHTLEDFVSYFRDTYLRDIPHGLTDTKTLVPKILEFYQARGSESSFRFLFRSLFGREIELSYPRDYVFTASDGNYERPTVLKLDGDSIVGNVALLETRSIVGLTSNARATVQRVSRSFEGSESVITLFVDDIITNTVTGDILVNSDVAADDGSSLLLTVVGRPPEGLPTVVYEYNLITEDAEGGQFIPGETVSTIPTNDPVSITGVVLGSVVGFTIASGGSGYAIGDVVYPPAGYNGGFGASGRVTAFANTDITGIDIVDGGEGYYAGLSLVVDNSGTGGSGLSGFVQNVSPGVLLLHGDVDANIADGDVLTFTSSLPGDIIAEFRASRERINYFEQGISLSEVVDSGVLLNAPDWASGNSLSALSGMNLSSAISQITTNLSVIPLYVNGSRTDIGAVHAVSISALGGGYTLAPPQVGVAVPSVPTTDIAGLVPVGNSYYTYEAASLSADVTVGQIGALEVVSSGAAYDTGPSSTFVVDGDTSLSSGVGAELGLVLSASTTGLGRFRDTRSMASSDRYLQSIEYYQPFSYVLTVEEDLQRFGDAVRRLVHPSGGLLLVRRTVTTDLNLASDAIGTTTGRIVGVPGSSISFVLTPLTIPVVVTIPVASRHLSLGVSMVPTAQESVGQGAVSSDLIYPYFHDTINGSSLIYFTAFSELSQISAYDSSAPGPVPTSPGLGDSA